MRISLRRQLFAFVLAGALVTLGMAPRADAQFRTNALSPADIRLVQGLYQNVIAGQRMARLALNEGRSAQVRQLGANATCPLNQAYDDLRLLARNNRVHLSDTLTAGNRRDVTRLTSAAARDFDALYVDTLLRELPPILQSAQSTASLTRDANPRALLTAAIPRIQARIAEVQAVKARM